MNQALARIYGLGLGLSGIALLLSLSDGTLIQRGVPLLLFAGLSLVVKRFGFHVFDESTERAPRRTTTADVTHSLVGVIDLAALLVYGPVFGGWVAVLSEFTYLVVRRPRRSWGRPERWEVALFNAGLKALMALAAGAVYTRLGGRYQPLRLTLDLVWPLGMFFLTWFVLDHIGWSVRVWLQSGTQAVGVFLRTIVRSSLLVELIPLPMALVLAVVYASLHWPIFALTAGGFIVTGWIIQRLVETRRRLRAQVSQLSTISEVSGQVAAILDLDELFTRVVELIRDNFEYDNVRIFTLRADNAVAFRAGTGAGHAPRRQLDYRIPLRDDSIIGWVALHGEPVVANDVTAEDRYAPDELEILVDTHAELAVPLTVEDRVLGVLDVQNREPHTFDKDDLFVLQTLADQVAIAIEDARLYQQALERERLAHELDVAREIQASLLPVALPVLAGWDIASAWQPARNVAGDFYDVIPLRDERWGLLIADVSDKGVPAALFMAVARTLIRAMVIGKGTPAAAIERANDLILADTRTDMFVTVFYAALDPVAATLTYVNAGHMPPILYPRAADEAVELRARGIALGVVPDIQLEQCTVSLAPGDLVVLYTDGITEAINSELEAFGAERLAACIRRNHALPAEDLVAAILNELYKFEGHGAAFDDQALLILKRIEGQ
jgi:serine phosphatase RsbU (regulator of sigma subunit)